MRTLSMKGGLRRHHEVQVVLPMPKSITPLKSDRGEAQMFDWTATLRLMKTEPLWRKWLRRAVRVVTYFW